MAEEMVNQSSSETTNDDVFETMFADDSTDDSTEENTEETEETHEDENQDTQSEEATDFLNIRYNGEDKALTQDEAIMLAQKGMNYDKVKGKLDALENGALKSISAIAERAGMTIDEYAERLNDFQEQSEITQIANEYQKKHPMRLMNTQMQSIRTSVMPKLDKMQNLKQRDKNKRMHTLETRYKLCTTTIPISTLNT